MGDGMTLGERAASKVRVGECVAPQQEERCAHAFALERIEHVPCRPEAGPSSNVSTTSLGASASVCGKCLRPTRGVAAAFTGRMRAVPSASALPGQGTASGTASARTAVA